MMFVVAAGYGIAICVATVALMQLSSVAHPLVVARLSARHRREAEPLRTRWTFGRKDIR
jgi:hypothetical protein